MKNKILISALLATTTCLTACAAKPTIDFEECITVDFSGYENEGHASVKMDSEYILSLLGDMNMLSAASLINSFEIDDIQQNGELSNGDTITVSIDTDAEILKNSNVNVANTELQFVVSGLEEKTAINIFDDVSLVVSGTSPECSISVEYNGEQQDIGQYSFTISSADGEEKVGYSYKNGDKVIVALNDSTIDYYTDNYILSETSREYIVQADSSYIESPEDITAEDMATLNTAVDEYLSQKTEAIISNTDDTAKISVVSGVTGIGAGTLAATANRVTSIDNISFNSSYIGSETEKGYFGSVSQKRYLYFFYDADISYYVNEAFSKKEGTVNGTLIVRITDPIISKENGISYSDIAIGARKDFDTAYNDKITENYTKLS